MNARLGRYAIPIGGHSLHGGFVLGSDASPVDIEIFADRWTHITDAMSRLSEWAGEEVRRVIAERLPDAPTRIPIETYLTVCLDEDEEKMRRFRDMMEFF